MQSARDIENTPTTIPPLPSIFELSRHARAVDAVHDRVSADAETKDPEAERLAEEVGDLNSDRMDGVRSLILTMPAVTIADAAAQLHGALALIEEMDEDKWKPRDRKALEHIRRAVLSVIAVTTREAGVNPDTFGMPGVPGLYEAAFPAVVAEGAAFPTGDTDDDVNSFAMEALAARHAREIVDMATRAKASPATIFGVHGVLFGQAIEEAIPGSARKLALGLAEARVSASKGSAARDTETPTPRPALWRGNDEPAERQRPDAALLSIAREFARLDERIEVLNDLPQAPESVMGAVMSRRWALTDVMIDTPATTRAGWRAKAEVLASTIDTDVASQNPEHRLAASLAADLMRDIAPDR
jgi:hypothetical protein